MAVNEKASLDAGEYVLGTLSVDEREAFERVMEREPALHDEVQFWERRLSGLDAAMADAEPREDVWKRIEGALPVLVAAGHGAPFAANDNAVRDMRRSRNMWRGFAAVAAALALALGFAAVNPGVSRNLGIANDGPRVAGLDGREFVAVVNSDGETPAMIVSVDAETGEVAVRSLAVQAVETDQSLELWYIPEGEGARSIGTLDEGTTIAAIEAQAGGTIAVSLEAKGGSPTGVAQGPVVYSGKLIAAD